MTSVIPVRPAANPPRGARLSPGMEIRISFGGGKRVDAHLDGRVIQTDQSPAHGGEGSAPEPFQLFLASLAACAGVYVLGFCQVRGIPTEGIEIVQHHGFEPETGRLATVRIEVSLPADFPSKYVAAVERVAAKCAVKRVIENPPEFGVIATLRETGELTVPAQPALA
jgi:putative redox protein